MKPTKARSVVIPKSASKCTRNNVELEAHIAEVIVEVVLGVRFGFRPMLCSIGLVGEAGDHLCHWNSVWSQARVQRVQLLSIDEHALVLTHFHRW